jgi:hypothetical protein
MGTCPFLSKEREFDILSAVESSPTEDLNSTTESGMADVAVFYL